MPLAGAPPGGRACEPARAGRGKALDRLILGPARGGGSALANGWSAAPAALAVRSCGPGAHVAVAGTAGGLPGTRGSSSWERCTGSPSDSVFALNGVCNNDAVERARRELIGLALVAVIRRAQRVGIARHAILLLNDVCQLVTNQR